MEDGRRQELADCELYVRQLAWLQSTPEQKKDKEPPKKSRWESIKGEPEFPEVSHQYLLDHLQNLGYASSTGMGQAVISFQEIMAYQMCVGIRLEPWEVLEIRRLSQAYIAQSHKSEDMSEPIPYVSTEKLEDEARQAKIADGVKNLFESRLKPS